MIAPNSAILELPLQMLSGLPKLALPDGRTITRPHPEWIMHQLRWRWLLDSWEGGEAYRMAVYGMDIHGMPVRNLIRHKREYPSAFDATYAIQTGRPPGTDPANQATDDDYEMRRARTPVPTFVAEAVETHLAKIYGREVRRGGPKPLLDWWEDVDGLGTCIDEWMASTIAPLLLVLGQLDILIDHPPVPEGTDAPRSRLDEINLGLAGAVASYILPENLVWWRLDARKQYAECVVREVLDDLDVRWRYWGPDHWILFNRLGKPIGPNSPGVSVSDMGGGLDTAGLDDPALAVHRHDFGRVPIVRLFDRRRPRCRNIGLPRYEAIADLMREYYNKDSELILSDTTQAHPLLQGPEDYCNADGTMQVGPNWLLPKKKSTVGTSATYEGFDVVEFPKAGAESIRLNKSDLRESVDRAACLTKPAGGAGTDGKTVAQSGVSKRLDTTNGNEVLGKIAKSLGRAERQVAELALLVLGKPAARQEIEAEYPTEFDLFSPDELSKAIGDLQLLLAAGGRAPEVEGPLLKRLVRQLLPGADEDTYAAMDKQIDEVLAEGRADIEAEPDADEDGLVPATGEQPRGQSRTQANYTPDVMSQNPDEMLG